MCATAFVYSKEVISCGLHFENLPFVAIFFTKVRNRRRTQCGDAIMKKRNRLLGRGFHGVQVTSVFRNKDEGLLV